MASVWESNPFLNRNETSNTDALNSVNTELFIVHTEIRKLDRLALNFYQNGNFYDSVNYLREAYEIRKEAYGESSEQALQNLSNLAAALARIGNFEEAHTHFERILKERKAALGDSHPSTLATINHMGVLMKQRFKLTEAYELLTQAFKGYYESNGKLLTNNLPAAEASYNYAVVCVQMGKRSLAARLFKTACDGLSKTLGFDHQHTLDALHWEKKCSQIKESSEENVYKSRSEWKDGVQCEICHAVFGIRERRHHCRICSRSVCSACSPYRTMVLEYDDKSPVRLCSVCEQQGF